MEPDSLLFGDKLNEKIKESKAMTKLGQEIKTPATTFVKKPTIQGNSKGPSISRILTQTGNRPRGNQKLLPQQQHKTTYSRSSRTELPRTSITINTHIATADAKRKPGN